MFVCVASEHMWRMAAHTRSRHLSAICHRLQRRFEWRFTLGAFHRPLLRADRTCRICHAWPDRPRPAPARHLRHRTVCDPSPAVLINRLSWWAAIVDFLTSVALIKYDGHMTRLVLRFFDLLPKYCVPFDWSLLWVWVNCWRVWRVVVWYFHIEFNVSRKGKSCLTADVRRVDESRLTVAALIWEIKRWMCYHREIQTSLKKECGSSNPK